MSEISLPMSLPLDSDGFLRRECPTCDRQFKWWPSRPTENSENEAGAESPALYFCPYCYEPSSTDAWWTQEQLEYAQGLVAAEVLGPQLRDFQDSLEGLNQSGGLIHVDTTLTLPGRPERLTEPDDMVRIDVPCHPEEPLKVDETWEGDVACLVCSIRYPVELVRAFPSQSEEA